MKNIKRSFKMKEEKNKITKKKKMMNVYTLVNVISIGMNTEK